MRLLLLMLCCAIIVTACNSTSQEDNNPALQTRALDKGLSEEEAEDFGLGYIARKWELGSEYIDFKNEGTFEAVLDNKHISSRWGLSYGTEDK